MLIVLNTNRHVWLAQTSLDRLPVASEAWDLFASAVFTELGWILVFDSVPMRAMYRDFVESKVDSIVFSRKK